MSGMEASPRGRRIEVLEGDGGTITTRGHRIESIGRQMVQSAEVLRDLVEGEDGQQGKAIEKVREIVGDTHAELRRAGELYEPTGPILVEYGRAVSSVQPLINAAVSAAEAAWSAYAGAPGTRDDRPAPLVEPEPGSAAAQQLADQAEDDARKRELYDEFRDEGAVFDRHYDTWDEAFDRAASSIGDVLEGSIRDSFWDDLDGVIAVVIEVLGYIGIAVAILGIIIGGPIFALIGAVIGVVTLLLTIYQVFRGDAGPEKLVIAIISVLPIGKVGKLFQGKTGMLDFGADMMFGLRPANWSAAAGQLRSLRTISGFSGGFFSSIGNGARGLWQMNNPVGVGDIMCRFMFGQNSAGVTNLAEAVAGSARGWCNSTVISGAWQGAYTMASGSWAALDKIALWTDNADRKPSSIFPWVGAVL